MARTLNLNEVFNVASTKSFKHKSLTPSTYMIAQQISNCNRKEIQLNLFV